MTGQDTPGSRNRAPVMLIVGLALLTLAWVFGNTPFGSPDETQHFLRAIGVGQGELIGPKADYPSEGLSRTKHAWVEQATRSVVVPDGLNPAGSDCAAQYPEVSAACVDDVVVPDGGRVGVQVGNYQPLGYVVPGVALLRGDDPVGALYLARVASVAQALAFLVAGAAALTFGRERRGAALGGIGLALTPMVVFLAASLNPSGLEIGAAFALIAGLLRLADQPNRATWALVGVSGAVLSASRSTGPVWVVAFVALFVVWHGPRRTRDLLRAATRPAAVVGAALLAGVVCNRLWEGAYGSRVTTIVPSASEAWTTFTGLADRMVRETIGDFGYLNVKLPTPAYWLWAALTLAAVVVAAVVVRGRFRVALLLTAGGLALLPTLQHYYVGLGSGYGVQARHVLPALVALPVVAAEALRRSEHRFAPVLTTYAPLVLLPVAALQLLAWWTNARRAAVGRAGPRWFASDAQWQPPLGWYPWIVFAVAGCALVAVAGVVAWRDSVTSGAEARGAGASRG